MATGQPSHIELTLADRPGATQELRAAIDRIADVHGVSLPARFDLKVAATEALTNALREATAGFVEVTLDGRPQALEIEVESSGPFHARRLRGDEGGRGIPLMLALVDSIEFAQTRRGTRIRMQKRIAA